jgi:Protein of unknown function (DUF3485)
MKNLIRVIAALSLIMLAGLVHGSWTNRWRPAPAVAALASRLDSVPMVLGDGAWTATSLELPDRELTMTGAVGYFSRIYSNPSKGVQVSVLLLCGLPGDMTTHTPDACYPGAGYTLGTSEGHMVRYGQPESQVEFRTAIASRSGSSPSVLRLFWAWRGSKGWSAPEEPRWSFASEPVLTKIYIVRETAGAVADPKNDPCNEFMSLLLPQLDSVLFSVSDRPSGESQPPSTSATPSQ